MEKEIEYSELMLIDAALQHVKTDINDKLTYYVGKFSKKLTKYVEKYNNLSGDINVENCSLDEKGNMLTDARGSLDYSKEGMRKRNAAMQELAKKTIAVDFGGCMCLDKTRVIKLPVAAVEILNGYLFDVTEEDYNYQEKK